MTPRRLVDRICEHPPVRLTGKAPAEGALERRSRWLLRQDAVARTSSREVSEACPKINELLYLFVRQLEWEQEDNPSAAWDVISAARSSNADRRAHARALLERCSRTEMAAKEEEVSHPNEELPARQEETMKAPYGIQMIENCMTCPLRREGFFCGFSPQLRRTLDDASHHSIVPAGALLFVEGQVPRGVHILCSGKVKLTTTSKDGRVLILRQAEAGDVLGLSAAISGMQYEMNAETASTCQLNFLGRQELLALLQSESEVGLHVALWMSREFQGAYRGIHDLVLARSSTGKLARLLLTSVPPAENKVNQSSVRSIMTHEEMAQRIGASRETVTRLLTDLKKRRLIGIDGTTLIIRDRTGLEALAV